VQAPNVETPEQIAERISVHRWLAPEQTIITSTCGFNHLPRHIALGKMRTMKEAKAILSGGSLRFGMSEDRSRRDQLERRLKATEERFRIAQVAGGIGWFVTDAWEWTCRVAVLFGFDFETPRPLFADWRPAIFIDDVPKLRSAVEATRERGPYYVEFRVTHPDGSVHWIAGKGEITKDETG
jgi:PAS domain-containing protein